MAAPDLTTSVGATATMVAAAWAAASRRANAVVSIDGGAGFPRMTDTFAARAVLYDQTGPSASTYGTTGRPRCRPRALTPQNRRCGSPKGR